MDTAIILKFKYTSDVITPLNIIIFEFYQFVLTRPYKIIYLIHNTIMILLNLTRYHKGDKKEYNKETNKLRLTIWLFLRKYFKLCPYLIIKYLMVLQLTETDSPIALFYTNI